MFSNIQFEGTQQGIYHLLNSSITEFILEISKIYDLLSKFHSTFALQNSIRNVEKIKQQSFDQIYCVSYFETRGREPVFCSRGNKYCEQ